MAKYESSVKELAYSQRNVYEKLSDLSNLNGLRERMDNPALAEQVGSRVSREDMEKAMSQLKSMKATPDELTIELPSLGEMQMKVVERTPDKCVKFQSVKSPIPFTFWIQVVPHGDEASKLKLTIDLSLNPFLRMMAEKPVKQGLEQLADMLAMIPYA